MEENVNFGTRIKRFFVIAILAGLTMVGGAIALNATKMSESTLAALGGVCLGAFLVMLPLSLVLLSLRFVVRAMEEREARHSARGAQPYGQPPVIIMQQPAPYAQFPQQQMWDTGQPGPIVTGHRQYVEIGGD